VYPESSSKAWQSVPENSDQGLVRGFTVHPKRSSDGIKAFLGLFAVTALLYSFHLGSWSLGASEAYSALAATQSSFAGVIQEALRFDPGKPPLYQLLLHCFVRLFGNSEASLRGFSVFFALLALIPLYALALSLFGPETALAALAIWAMNPVAFVLGQWARMYSLFIAAVLASMLAFWRLRQRASKPGIAAYGMCTALVLYTHLCGLLFVGIQAVLVTRDSYHSRRTRGCWTGLAIALALFAPFIPREVAQTRELLFGHWLDWIGTAHSGGSLSKIVVALVAGVALLALVFGPQLETDDFEPLWFCATWLLIPLVAVTTISLIARPVFAPRYIAPAIPVLALLVARGLELFGRRVRNLSAAAIAMAFAMLFFLCKAQRYEPWRDIAQEIEASGAVQPVFFESSLAAKWLRGRAEVDPGPDTDFPAGYFRVPFDYYFKGPNPRLAINPFRPAAARREIGDAALKAGGAWLISSGGDAIARSEMPHSPHLQVSSLIQTKDASLYHLVVRK
jgi:uncharacterized membrane protein